MSTVLRDRAASERLAFDFEHARLYDALERAAQLAELAGHDGTAIVLRNLRREVAADIERGGCEAIAPSIVLVSDDVDEAGRPNEWNAAGMASAAGERDA